MRLHQPQNIYRLWRPSPEGFRSVPRASKELIYGRSFEAPFEIIDHEPNRRYGQRGTEEHPVAVTMVFAYEPLW